VLLLLAGAGRADGVVQKTSLYRALVQARSLEQAPETAALETRSPEWRQMEAASLEAAPPCPRKGDAVAVVTRVRQVWLCRDGAPEARFPVALGAGGLDKRRKGDGRTPLGTYALGAPRASERFGTFIPIAYPTRSQAARGLTGGAVGIHGPPRGRAEPEYPTTAVDWTQGCVATGTDAGIEVIAAFVRERQPVIVIR